MLYKIRRAEVRDLLPIYHFICILEETNFTFLIFKSIFEANIKHADYYYLVAEHGKGNIVGFISCHTQKLLHHCGKVAEIQELFVEKKHRKAGIGRQLVQTLENTLKVKSCILFEVTAQKKRLGVHRFYESTGFKSSHKKFVKELEENGGVIKISYALKQLQ